MLNRQTFSIASRFSIDRIFSKRMRNAWRQQNVSSLKIIFAFHDAEISEFSSFSTARQFWWKFTKCKF